MKRILLMAVMLMAVIFVPQAYATNRGDLTWNANVARAKVVKRHGVRAAGRDIVKYGIRFVAADHSRRTRRAKPAELRRYTAQLRLLVKPHPYIATHAGPPPLAPAGTGTPHYSPTGVAACIVGRESGGDPQANNGTHFGVGQWDIATWNAHHGPEMTGAASPLGASYDQQLQVLNRALAEGKIGAWRPYDGC